MNTNNNLKLLLTLLGFSLISLIYFYILKGIVFLPFLSHYILSTLFIIVGLLISVAYFTLLERKVMASMQRRKGPNVVGF